MKLGKIETVNIRDVWKDEARDFTPWLASEEGLQLLGNELGVELELDSIEKKAVAYKADIVAKIVSEEGEEDHIVVIENQLNPTDHDHLGKVITYAAGHDAVTCVWIARSFNDDHRQAVDWLNEHMMDIAFFAFEIGLKRIGDSDPAPFFKMISSPNEWTRAVRSTKPKKYSDVKIDQLNFWKELQSYANLQKGSGVQFSRKPKAQHWYSMAIGRSGYNIELTINSITGRVGCELRIRHDEEKALFEQLILQKEEIENQLGYPLEWKKLEDKKATRLAVFHSGSIDENRLELMEWLYQRACEFYKVFSPRIQKLK